MRSYFMCCRCILVDGKKFQQKKDAEQNELDWMNESRWVQVEHIEFFYTLCLVNLIVVWIVQNALMTLPNYWNKTEIILAYVLEHKIF